MPYIKEKDRISLAKSPLPNNPGELNYLLTLLCLDYLSQNGNSYQQINDVIGALEGCKLEFYRRFAAPYEDSKIKENGDVYL